MINDDRGGHAVVVPGPMRSTAGFPVAGSTVVADSIAVGLMVGPIGSSSHYYHCCHYCLPEVDLAMNSIHSRYSGPEGGF